MELIVFLVPPAKEVALEKVPVSTPGFVNRLFVQVKFKGVAVGVGVIVAVLVGVFVGGLVGVFVAVGVLVGVLVGVFVGVLVGVAIQAQLRLPANSGWCTSALVVNVLTLTPPSMLPCVVTFASGANKAPFKLCEPKLMLVA